MNLSELIKTRNHIVKEYKGALYTHTKGIIQVIEYLVGKYGTEEEKSRLFKKDDIPLTQMSIKFNIAVPTHYLNIKEFHSIGGLFSKSFLNDLFRLDSRCSEFSVKKTDIWFFDVFKGLQHIKDHGKSPSSRRQADLFLQNTELVQKFKNFINNKISQKNSQPIKK